MKNNDGFTLIELLLIIAVILTLGAMSAIFYARFLTQNTVSNVADTLAGELRKAQIYSMSGRAGTSWGVNYSSDNIKLFATGNPSMDENNAINSNISITGFTTVTFAQITGTPSATFTASISGQNNFKNVGVNAQGAVLR